MEESDVFRVCIAQIEYCTQHHTAVFNVIHLHAVELLFSLTLLPFSLFFRCFLSSWFSKAS